MNFPKFAAFGIVNFSIKFPYLEILGMKKEKLISTMRTLCNINKFKEVKLVEENKYQGMINFILYLIASLLNVFLSVCVHAFKQTPKNHKS